MNSSSSCVLITGVLGLIGSTTAEYFLDKGYSVVGVDNNMRQEFFGVDASVLSSFSRLKSYPSFTFYQQDIRDTEALQHLFQEYLFDGIFHTAAQPSHDWAKNNPRLDFEVNALATLQLLELVRQHQPTSTFVFTSTNKVYGDNPNKHRFIEQETRYELPKKLFAGFDEKTSLDNCMHSLFGASKLAADVYVQEYGKYFGLKTALLRLGCVTGKNHAGVKLHGFLSYLVKAAVQEIPYTIIGYKGKQVRDQIHAVDVARAFEAILRKPCHGEVFNLGGGRENASSILELKSILQERYGLRLHTQYEPIARMGDHQCYITNYNKFTKYYPDWHISYTLPQILDEVVNYERDLDSRRQN